MHKINMYSKGIIMWEHREPNMNLKYSVSYLVSTIAMSQKGDKSWQERITS